MRKRIRICALEGCDKDISNLRVDAKYCCATHRATGVRQSKQKLKTALDVKAPKKTPKDLMMPSIAPAQTCAATGCKFPAKGRGSYCSDVCRKRHNREVNKNSRKDQVYEKNRTKKEFTVAENYTRLYNSLQTHEERLKMIRGALLYASTSPKDKTKYTEDIMMLRRTFRSPILSRGVGNAQVLIKKVGDLFPMYVAGYLQAVYHCTAKEFLNDPDMTPAANESAWDGKPLPIEEKNRKGEDMIDFDDETENTNEPSDETVTEVETPARRSIDAILAESSADDVRLSDRNVLKRDEPEPAPVSAEELAERRATLERNLANARPRFVHPSLGFTSGEDDEEYEDEDEYAA